jgi:hypothetical protein
MQSAIMPTSDMIFFVLGIADYVFVLAFVAVTGWISHRARRSAEKESTTQGHE